MHGYGYYVNESKDVKRNGKWFEGKKIEWVGEPGINKMEELINN